MARHLVVKKNDDHFLVGTHSAKILKALKKAGTRGLSYSQLRRQTKTKVDSLYVYSQRLRAAKLIQSRPESESRERRLFLIDPQQVTLSKAKRIG